MPRTSAAPGVASVSVQGKQLSFNNINDTDAALRGGGRIPSRPHLGGGDREARQSLRRGGRRVAGRGLYEGAGLRSRFGLRRHHRRQPDVDAEAAKLMTEIFTEVIVAPDAHRGGDRPRRRKKNCACCSRRPAGRARGGPQHSHGGRWPPRAEPRQRHGGRSGAEGRHQARATAQELSDLRFAFRVAKHVKSNTIIYAKNGATVGIGAGQDEPRGFGPHRRPQGAGCGGRRRPPSR